MRFHLVSLPHTETTAEFCACAYTQKVVKFCRMMMTRGHECFLYAGEANEAPCTEHVVVVTRAQQREWFGEVDHGTVYPMRWEVTHPAWRCINSVPVAEIRRRARPGDFLLLIGGNCQAPIARALPDLMAVEYGIGYEGVFAQFRAFESHAWRHYVAGLCGENDLRPFDAVVPNYFDLVELPMGRGGSYFLYVGRLVPRKGVQIAVDACRALGTRLVMAGQRSNEWAVPPDVEYVGHVGIAERAELMGGARAVFVPTQYVEPFGGVAVEATLCGTPVLTSDHGAFPETVREGVSGFRCSTMGEYVRAAQESGRLDRARVRAWSASRYSLEAVAPLYGRWFGRLSELWASGGVLKEVS